MGPEPEDGPPCAFEVSRGLYVTLTIPGDLCAPIGHVGSRRTIVVWATVPEAAVDEDGDSCTGEDDISGSAKAGQWPKVHSVTQALGMKKVPNSQLRLGVPGSVTLHRCSSGGSGGPGVFHTANVCLPQCSNPALFSKQRHGIQSVPKLALGLRAEVALVA